MNPSFGYLDRLSGGNQKFKKKIIDIILSELPKDFEVYQAAFQTKNYHLASEIVHRIKQKITFLEMAEDFDIVDQYENDLREGKLNKQKEFEDIIHKLLKFLSRTHD